MKMRTKRRKLHRTNLSRTLEETWSHSIDAVVTKCCELRFSCFTSELIWMELIKSNICSNLYLEIQLSKLVICEEFRLLLAQTTWFRFSFVSRDLYSSFLRNSWMMTLQHLVDQYHRANTYMAVLVLRLQWAGEKYKLLIWHFW